MAQVKILRNKAVTSAAAAIQTSTVNEPSLAKSGNRILFTGNWFAARSANDGSAWTAVDPFTFFPPAHGGFCCDQTAYFIPSINATVWILQYVHNNTANTLRVAVKVGPIDSAGAWKWWDLVPGQVDPAWAGEWFDYNHAALSDNFFYIGTNSFALTGNAWRRSIIFRIPIADLAGTGPLQLERFVSTTNFSLRCVQGAGNTMYFASHEGNQARQLRVFAWPETSTNVTSRVISITPWVPPPYSAPFQGGTNWLGRADQRITGAWIGGGRLGFMWTAGRQGPARPFPYVRVVRLAEANMAIVDEPDIWSAKTAFAYPEAAANSVGVPGVALFSGGGTAASGGRQPSHVVGFRDDPAAQWRLAVTATSTHSPAQPKWGDYLTCRRDSPNARDWVASGFTLQGGGDIRNVEPRYVRFSVV